MRLALLVPNLPPTPDGIGDYTYCLAEALLYQENCEVTLLTGPGNFWSPPGCRIVTGAYAAGTRVLQTLPQALHAEQPDWLILQYNPFLYDRRGLLNPWLIAALARCRWQMPGLRIALMAHELCVPLESFKFVVMGLAQRLQIRLLMPLVDINFGSIETFTTKLRNLAPHKPGIHLPVGSNIPIHPLALAQRQQMRQALGLKQGDLLLGAFGSSHYGKMQQLMLRTLTALRKTGLQAHLLFIGSGSEHIDALCPSELVPYLHTTGFVSTERVSHYLQLVDVFLAPFMDGISTRRTSAISALAHGLPVVSTVGHLTEDFWHWEYPHRLVSATDEEGFIDAVLQTCHGTHLENWDFYSRYFSWEKITSNMLSALA